MYLPLLIFAVAITNIVADYQDPSITSCKPNAKFKVHCNTCVCNKFGSGAACTRMACPPHRAIVADETYESILPEDAPCAPGKSFMYYCNQCFCNRNGKGAACTRMACPPGLFNKDGTMNVPAPLREKRNIAELPEDGTCIAGESYKNGCNTCYCVRDDQAICTTNACVPNLLAAGQRRQTDDGLRWGPPYVQGDPCIPKEHFRSECNQCRCMEDGVSAVCTIMACPQP